MKLLPEYCENIIVGVIYNNRFSWYITKINIWYLDYKKYYEKIRKQYIDMGRTQKRFEYEVGTYDFFCGDRWGIEIINSNEDIDKFIRKIEKYNVSCEELKEYRLITDDTNACYPSLLVDFDKKIFYNYIQEPYFLHEYVPENWLGKYENFYSIIPKNQSFFN